MIALMFGVFSVILDLDGRDGAAAKEILFGFHGAVVKILSFSW